MTSREAPAGATYDAARAFALRGVKTAGFAVVIAAILWVVLAQPYPVTLVYSLCISLSCWLLIDGARVAASAWLNRRAAGVAQPQPRSHWPGWPWMVPIVLGGSVFGYAIGNEIGNALLGQNLPGPFNAGLRQALVFLVMAVVPGIVITYVFQSRETIAAQEAQVQHAERQAAEQRLKLIESQLEPHMLFNTLANLRALIGVDPARAQAMLDLLIAFLRGSLAGSRASLGTVEDEFARLADYLALMQIRMGSRLAARFEVEPGAARARLPSLLLQPLVENAIKHGLEPQVGGGRIDVTAAREGDALLVRIRDSGVGPDAGVPPRGGFGLGHVRERLQTLYGERAVLAIAPAAEADGGTLVTVRLPFDTTPLPAPEAP